MKLDTSWQKALSSEWEKPYFKKLMNFVHDERLKNTIFPPEEEVFAALEACALNMVKVVIVGQDPYHGLNQAHGLCFSVKKGVKIPPSLRNIFKELQADLGIKPADHGDLSSWARQGVLLLNTTLTVREGLPLSHAKQGWEEFTHQVLRVVAEQKEPKVFLLWGNSAKKKFQEATDGLSVDQHCILMSAHPSPLSARHFLGNKHFSLTNNFLTKQGIEPINFNISL